MLLLLNSKISPVDASIKKPLWEICGNLQKFDCSDKDVIEYWYPRDALILISISILHSSKISGEDALNINCLLQPTKDNINIPLFFIVILVDNWSKFNVAAGCFKFFLL